MPKSPKPKGDEPELAAFAVRSRSVHKDPVPPRKSKDDGTAAAASARAQSTVMVPYVGRIKGVDDVKLCTDPDAGIEQHVEDTERLVQAFQAAVGAHETLIAKAVALTEERCAAEKRAAVEAATLAAIRTTEQRCASDKRVAVEEAVKETAAAAKIAQEAAVAEAIRLTEARCAEQQRVAVQAATISTARSLGRSEDELVADTAASNFEQAAASAGAALAAVSSLLDEKHGPLAESTSSPKTAANGAAAAALPADSAPEKDDSLHFF